MRTGELQVWAAARGLVLGVAAVRTFEEGRAALEWRAGQGFSTPFAAGSQEERYRPDLLYPQARSLVVAARPHLASFLQPGPGQGVIARYALGPDYHEELGNDLRELANRLKQTAGARLAVVQVDSGPLLEREAARLAGLGYYGASCNLIIPGLGTGFTLGLVITDLVLESGAPLKPAACRNCGRCLAACPTGALLAPGRLNPERCLSYLTQKRGIIPPEWRSALGSYIWGCDACQEVCPENRRVGETTSRPGAGLLRAGSSWPRDGNSLEPLRPVGSSLLASTRPGVGDSAGSLPAGPSRQVLAAAPGGDYQQAQGEVTPCHPDRVPPHLTYPDLATIITLDRAGFNHIFGGTALAWRGKTVLQRNAAIALGNQGDPAALAPLQQALHAPAAVLRAHAAWALGRLGSAGRPALTGALATEADPLVCREILAALDFKTPGEG